MATSSPRSSPSLTPPVARREGLRSSSLPVPRASMTTPTSTTRGLSASTDRPCPSSSAEDTPLPPSGPSESALVRVKQELVRRDYPPPTEADIKAIEAHWIRNPTENKQQVINWAFEELGTHIELRTHFASNKVGEGKFPWIINKKRSGWIDPTKPATTTGMVDLTGSPSPPAASPARKRPRISSLGADGEGNVNNQTDNDAEAENDSGRAISGGAQSKERSLIVRVCHNPPALSTPEDNTRTQFLASCAEAFDKVRHKHDVVTTMEMYQEKERLREELDLAHIKTAEAEGLLKKTNDDNESLKSRLAQAMATSASDLLKQMEESQVTNEKLRAEMRSILSNSSKEAEENRITNELAAAKIQNMSAELSQIKGQERAGWDSASRLATQVQEIEKEHARYQQKVKEDTVRLLWELWDRSQQYGFTVSPQINKLFHICEIGPAGTRPENRKSEEGKGKETVNKTPEESGDLSDYMDEDTE